MERPIFWKSHLRNRAPPKKTHKFIRFTFNRGFPILSTCFFVNRMRRPNLCNQAIGLHHPLDGITNPEYKLLHFIQLTIFCKKKRALAFNRDRCCHLALCLLLILFHWHLYPSWNNILCCLAKCQVGQMTWSQKSLDNLTAWSCKILSWNLLEEKKFIWIFKNDSMTKNGESPINTLSRW